MGGKLFPIFRRRDLLRLTDHLSFFLFFFILIIDIQLWISWTKTRIICIKISKDSYSTGICTSSGIVLLNCRAPSGALSLQFDSTHIYIDNQEKSFQLVRIHFFPSVGAKRGRSGVPGLPLVALRLTQCIMCMRVLPEDWPTVLKKNFSQ